MKKFYILLFALITTCLGFGQTTLYSDNFTGEDNKGRIGATTDLVGVDWTIDTSSGSFSNASDFFAVISGQFEAQDVDGDVVFTSETFSISGYNSLSFNFDAGASGDFEASGDIYEVRVYVDGSPQLLFDGFVDESAPGDPMFFGATQLSSTLQNFTQSISGTGTNAYLEITVNNNAGTEAYFFDNLEVTGFAVTSDTSVQFETTSASVAEDSGTYDLVVEIANEDAAATTFDVVLTSGDTADIDSYSTQSETFPGSSTTDITVTVTITDDAIIEGDEDFVFEIQNVAGGNNAAVGPNGTFTLTILANDAPPPTEGWQITSEDTSFVIDFDTTVSGVNEGAFNGTGFTTAPASGQLDSDAWAATGMSDGALSFGGSETSGDYARGSSTGGVSGGGFYAFDTGSGNNSLGFQGTGSDFTPGSFTLRVQNQTGNTVTDADLAYLIYVLNDQGRGNSFNLSYSTDDVSYTDVTALDFTTEEIADGVPAWSSTSRSTLITGLSIADEGYLYLRWSSNDVNGGGSRDEIAIDDIDLTFNPAGATTYTFTGTWAPSDPNGNATAGDDIIIASGDAVISSNTTCNSVTVNAGAGLTVNTGITLTTSNGVALESTATTYSSLILDGTIGGAGAITYERHVNINGSGDTGSNDLISAPLTGQQFNLFEDANPNILSGSGATADLRLFGPFDKTIGDYVTWNQNDTFTLDPGVGYRAASNDNMSFTFTGTANNGNVNVGILNSGPQEEEWNLIGNPYPSYMNVQDFLNHEVSPGVTNLSLFNAGTAAIYGYDGSASNGWTIYNLATTTAATVITPGQGFFVSSANPSATVGFTPAMRSTGTADDFIIGRQGDLTFVKLFMSTDTDSYETEVYFNENASLGFDFGFDAEFFATPPAFSLFTQLVEENEGAAFTIQAVDLESLAGVTINLGVNAFQGQQLTFTLSEISLPPSTEVYIDDTVANTSTLLTMSDYVLTPTTDLSNTGRFFLRFFDPTLSTVDIDAADISITALSNTNEIIINGQLKEDSIFDIVDIQGRNVMSVELDASLVTNRIDVSSLSAGVYITQVRNSVQQKSQKVILK